MKYSSIIIILFLLMRSIAIAQEDQHKYYDDGGASKYKNAIFTDIAYFYKPYYFIGYRHQFSKHFSTNAGIILLGKNHEYSYPLSENDSYIYHSGEKINLFTTIYYHLDVDKPFRTSTFSFGYHLVFLDYVALHTIYWGKSIISFDYKRIYFFVNFEFGVNLFKGKYDDKDIVMVKSTSYSGSGIYCHIPVQIGFRF